MIDESLAIDQNTIRGTDTNSLLRLYDRARAILGLCSSQYERGRAEKVLLRLSEELRKRNVPVSIGPSTTAPSRLLNRLPVPDRQPAAATRQSDAR